MKELYSDKILEVKFVRVDCGLGKFCAMSVRRYRVVLSY